MSRQRAHVVRVPSAATLLSWSWSTFHTLSSASATPEDDDQLLYAVLNSEANLKEQRADEKAFC